MLENLLAAVPLGIWTYVAFARGGFWRVRPLLPEQAGQGLGKRRVTAIVPARDEAAVVERSIGSLLQQSLPEPLYVIVVDDHSTDDTAEKVRAAAMAHDAADRVTLIPGAPLAPGWTPKLWAMQQGVEAGSALEPEYFLFTDADIEHDSNSIARLIATAERHRVDLASCMVKLATDSPAERLLIPAFVYFFFQLYPPAWIGSHRHKTAGAAGGCILVRRDALSRAGGLYAIRDKVIDDCALAAAIKRSGGRLWLGVSEDAGSIRSYGGFGGVGQMIARLAFYQLRHSYALLLLTVVGLGITYVAPVGLLLSRRKSVRLLGISALGLMGATYVPVVRFYRRPVWQALTLPVVAVFYAGATVYSAWQYVRGKGGRWKGRIQDVRV